MRREASLLFIGHFGGSNTGDEAMLAGMLSAMRPEDRRRVLVMTKPGMEAVVARVHRIETRPASAVQTFRAILQSGQLVLVGGTHHHDDYSSARYRRHAWYMTRIALLGVCARLLGRRVLWLGVGVGPVRRPFTRFITRTGAACCHAITVRDSESERVLAEVAPSLKILKGFDLAGLLADEVSMRAERRDGKILGISVTSVGSTEWGGQALDDELWARFERSLRAILLRDPTLSVRIFEIRGGAREADTELSQRLVESLRTVDDSRVRLCKYQDDPTTTLHEISGCTHFVATRYHSGVLAYLAHCHLWLLSYHEKVAALAASIALPPSAVVSLNPIPSEEAFVKGLELLLASDERSRADLPTSAAMAGARICASPLTG